MDMGGESGYIPREEAAVGLTEGRIRDIAGHFQGGENPYVLKSREGVKGCGCFQEGRCSKRLWIIYG